MKGTQRRGASRGEDERGARLLRDDPKSRAENLMIVDLLRNDLSIVCEPGTVRVPRLFATEQHETLIQMTSTVSGRLRPDVTYRELFGALFPCGSVTGAPKIRAMQIISALEPSPRGVYCGAVGWMGPGGRSVFNVAIRTAEVTPDGRGRLGVGSGIVADSDEREEYAESLLKGRFFFRAAGGEGAVDPGLRLIETMRWDGGIALLPLHMKRLAASAECLGFALDDSALVQSIEAKCAEIADEQPRKVRLELLRDGRAEIDVSRLAAEESRTRRLGIAAERLLSQDPLLRHKTTARERYRRMHAAAQARGLDDVLFMNERGELCEGTVSSLFLRLGGRLLTPPVASGLLPGVYREYLLRSRSDTQEQVLKLEDLLEAEQVYVCNAVRGLQMAVLERDAQGRIVVVGDPYDAAAASSADADGPAEGKLMTA